MNKSNKLGRGSDPRAFINLHPTHTYLEQMIRFLVCHDIYLLKYVHYSNFSTSKSHPIAANQIALYLSDNQISCYYSFTTSVLVQKRDVKKSEANRVGYRNKTLCY